MSRRHLKCLRGARARPPTLLGLGCETATWQRSGPHEGEPPTAGPWEVSSRPCSSESASVPPTPRASLPAALPSPPAGQPPFPARRRSDPGGSAQVPVPPGAAWPVGAHSRPAGSRSALRPSRCARPPACGRAGLSTRPSGVPSGRLAGAELSGAGRGNLDERRAQRHPAAPAEPRGPVRAPFSVPWVPFTQQIVLDSYL